MFRPVPVLLLLFLTLAIMGCMQQPIRYDPGLLEGSIPLHTGQSRADRSRQESQHLTGTTNPNSSSYALTQNRTLKADFLEPSIDQRPLPQLHVGDYFVYGGESYWPNFLIWNQDGRVLREEKIENATVWVITGSMKIGTVNAIFTNWIDQNSGLVVRNEFERNYSVPENYLLNNKSVKGVRHKEIRSYVVQNKTEQIRKWVTDVTGHTYEETSSISNVNPGVYKVMHALEIGDWLPWRTEVWSNQVLEIQTISVPAGTFTCWKTKLIESGHQYYYKYYDINTGILVREDNMLNKSGRWEMIDKRELKRFHFSGDQPPVAEHNPSPSSISDASAAPIQPRLHLAASALGKNDDGKTLQFEVPERVGIKVTFTASVPEESNSNYRYYWVIDGEPQSSNMAQLTKELSPTPKDKPHNVVLKAEKLDDMRTAQSTPPIYRPAMLEASIQVSIKENKEWDCKGRLGSGCSDGDIINKTTTQYTVVPCDHPKNGQICIKSLVSGGAIQHDRCCQEHNNIGYVCGGVAGTMEDPAFGYAKSTPITIACKEQFLQAGQDKIQIGKPMFEHTWVYPPDGTDPPSTGTRDVWWKNFAPPGTVISYRETEPEQIDKDICQSGKAQSLKVLTALEPGGYAGSTPPTTIWFCSANKTGEKIDLSWPKTLVNPQGKINNVGNKIVPAVKSKAKKDTPAGCNKDPNVLSPSTGSAEGALKKYGTDTDGCAQ